MKTWQQGTKRKIKKTKNGGTIVTSRENEFNIKILKEALGKTSHSFGKITAFMDTVKIKHEVLRYQKNDDSSPKNYLTHHLF